MNSWDLRKLLGKLLAVVVIGAPFAFLGGLIWYVLPKDQAPVEMAENVENIDETETEDSIMSYTGVIDDELAPQDTISTVVSTVTGGSGAVSHGDSLLHRFNHRDSVLNRSVLASTNSPKIIIRSHNDFGKTFIGVGKEESVTVDSVSLPQAQPIENMDIAPIDTLGNV